MKITSTYQELSDIIQAKTNHDIDFAYVSPDTVKISKEIKIPLIGTASVGMNISVIGFEGHDLILKATSDVISKLVSLVKGLDINKYASISENKIVVHLDAIEQMEKIFEHVDLKAVCFTNSAVEMDAELKHFFFEEKIKRK